MAYYICTVSYVDGAFKDSQKKGLHRLHKKRCRVVQRKVTDRGGSTLSAWLDSWCHGLLWMHTPS